MIKGKAAGWQSTLANPRFPECISAFSTALSYAPADKRNSVIKEIKEDISSISCALIRLRAERFIKWPDAEEATGFISDITTILKTVRAFLTKGIAISIDDIMSPVAEIINQSVIKAYKSTIFPDYKSQEYPYPRDPDFSKYIDRIDFCIQLVEQSIKLCDKDGEADIQRYEKLIELQEYAINACSYDYEYSSAAKDSYYANQLRAKGYIVDSYNSRVYFVKSRLSDSAVDGRKKLISEYQSKIHAIEAEIDRKIKAEKKKKRDEFWSKHSEEHKALNEELRKTKQKRDELTKAQKGYSKVELLDKHIAEITAILEEDRNPTSQLKKSEKDFITNCDNFWSSLSSNDGYDEYLDSYPILKKAEEYSQRRSALIAKKAEIESLKEERKNGIIAKILLVTFIAGVLACIILPICIEALEDLVLLFVFLGAAIFAGGIALGVAGPFQAASQKASAENIERMEFNYLQDLTAYNKTIDEMNAVPKYTGIVNSRRIRIPEKIKTDTEIRNLKQWRKKIER